MSIGSQIKSRRKELKISQEDLAKKIGVSRSAVSNWEIERNYPDLQIIVSLSEVLGLSLDALLKEDSAVVGKITEDTVKRKRFSKWIIALIVILAMVVVLLFCVLFETKTLSISHKEQIEYINVSDDIVKIKVKIPKFRSVGDYYAGVAKDDSRELHIELLTRRDFSFANLEEIQIPIDSFEGIERVVIVDDGKIVTEYDVN